MRSFVVVAALASSLAAAGALARPPPPTTPCHVDGPSRTLTVRVSPWADILVDGHLVARGQKSAAVALAPGPHAVSFRNPEARDVDRVVLVPAAGPVPELSVALERRTALVLVRARRARVDVRVEEPRDPPTRHRVELVAGHGAAVEVRLAPPPPGP